jgi:hypothetical protein
VPTLIGVDHRGLVKPLQHVLPDYMVMGERGMADMGEMEMLLPDNTAPMMTGHGQFGPLEMGGMFTVLKVRADQKAGDYSDPGPYAFPAGTVAREYSGPLPEPARFASEQQATGGKVTGLHNPNAIPNAVPNAPRVTDKVQGTVVKPKAGQMGQHKH